MFFWIDIETTGLDENKCSMLEVACIATTDNLKPIETFETVINDFAKQPISKLALPPVFEPGVKSMHAKSGLLSKLPNGIDSNGVGLPLLEAEEELLAFMYRFEPRANRSYMAGNSVHFDRKFLNLYMPAVSSHMCHRHLDVSAIGILLTSIYGEAAEFKEPRPHRALQDLFRSIRQLEFYTKFLINV